MQNKFFSSNDFIACHVKKNEAMTVAIKRKTISLLCLHCRETKHRLSSFKNIQTTFIQGSDFVMNIFHPLYNLSCCSPFCVQKGETI